MITATYFDLLARNLEARADHPALNDNSSDLTYEGLHDITLTLAARLHALGVRRNDRVGIYLPRGFEEVIASFAVARLGGIFVYIHHQWSSAQTLHVVRDCQIQVLITDNLRADRIIADGWPDPLTSIITTAASAAHPQIIPWPGRGGEHAPLPPNRAIDLDLATILYTSGSTGLPKGVMISHRNLIEATRLCTSYLENSAEDRLLGLLPLSFGFGLTQLTSMCLVGGTYLLPPLQMAHELLQAVVQRNVTGLGAVPTVWDDIVSYLQDSPMALPSLRYISCGGASTPRHVLEALPRLLPGVQIYQGYGFTEALRSTIVPWQWFQRKMGSLGRAIPNVELYVINPGVGVCAPGQQGELVHRSSLISPGYWGRPEDSADKIKPCPELAELLGDEKVAYSGDIVTMDEDGFYWFIGREDTMIKTSGYRVSPTEIEAVVLQSGLVAEAVAWGVNHETLTQTIHVAVAPGPAQPETVDVDALLLFCRRNMPTYQVPRRIHVWAGSLPRNAHGKLDRPRITGSTE